MNLYGFFIALGILVGALAVEKLKRYLRSDPDFIEDSRQSRNIINHISIYSLFPWVIIPGVIGARLYHVINFYSYYSQNWIEVFYLWQGGLGIYGGILGGIVGLWAYCWFIEITHLCSLRSPAIKTQVDTNLSGSLATNLTRSRSFGTLSNLLPALPSISQYLNISISNFLFLLDLAAIGLPLGQAIGRIGNYFNQELYGLPTNLPWGIDINLENRLPGYEQFSKFHPLFLYESLSCLVIFIILIKFFLLRLFQERAEVKTNFYSVFESRANKSTDFIYSKSQRSENKNTHKNCLSPRAPGTIFFTYLFLYSFLRFWLEFLRIDSWIVEGIRINQLVAVFCVLISIIYLLYKKRPLGVK